MSPSEETLHQRLNQFPNETNLSQDLDERVLAAIQAGTSDPPRSIVRPKRLAPIVYTVGSLAAVCLLIIWSLSPISPFAGQRSASYSRSNQSANSSSNAASKRRESNASGGTMSGSSSSSSSASWTYPFVSVNGNQYSVSTDQDKVVSAKDVGEKIGVVSVELSDTHADQVKENISSNILTKGTPLYIDKKDSKTIIFKQNGRYYKAEKIKP